MVSSKLILAPFAFTLLLTACNGPSLAESGPQFSPPNTRPAASAAASAAPVQTKAVGAPAQAQAQTAPAQTSGGAAAPAQSVPGPAAQGDLSSRPPTQRMIIKNATLGIAVEDPEASLSQVDQLVASEQGVISSQTVRTQEDKTFVNLVIQVPPDQFEDTLAKLRDMRAHGTRVLTDTVSGQDVTEQFVDLDAQYRNLATTRDAYQKLLDKATSVSDIITLTREISNIQTQMDQIQGRKNLLTRQSGISTINLSMSPVGATPSLNPRPLPQPAQAAQQAWQALQTALQGLAVILIWMAVLLPLPALLLGGGWLIYRRATRPAAYQAEASRN